VRGWVGVCACLCVCECVCVCVCVCVCTSRESEESPSRLGLSRTNDSVKHVREPSILSGVLLQEGEEEKKKGEVGVCV